MVHSLEDISTKRRLSEAVLSARRRRGWSQRELASRSGLSVSLIVAYEKGSVSPTLRSFFRLSGIFGERWARWCLMGDADAAPQAVLEEFPEVVSHLPSGGAEVFAEILGGIRVAEAALARAKAALIERSEVYRFGEVVEKKEAARKKGAASRKKRSAGKMPTDL